MRRNRRRFAAVMAVSIQLAAATFSAAEEQLEALEEQAFREAAALAAPSIVRIDTVGGLDVVGTMLTGSGPTTGVVVGEDGWIITSTFNFASQPSSILVTTADGLRHPARRVASDQSRMLTLLKIEASRLTPLSATPRNKIAVGQWSVALGQTFDQPFPNVSVGIVSAVGRIWGRAIQTDAKISPANYGGPLVDVYGRGMGVLVPLSPQKSGETAGVEWYDSGIGFAVPLEDVYAVLDRLQAGEELKPGKMGVGFDDRGPISGKAIVNRIRPGSPADEAELKVGDTIVAADGLPVDRLPHLRHILGRKYAGEELSVKILRDEVTIDATLTLTAELVPYERPLLGVLPLRTARSESSESGVTVRFVLPGSPADQAELKRRDRIVELNDEPIADAAALAEQVSRSRVGDSLTLKVVREGSNSEIEATLAPFTGGLPDALPTAAVPAAVQTDDPPMTGRIVETLGGDDERAYWAFVPDSYNPDYGYGLVVWLHPPGDTKEADVLKAWRTHCERRGLILLAPKTSRPSGWTPADVDFVQDLVDEFQEQYTIDADRIVLHASAGAGTMAAVTAFRQRETFRGLSLVVAPLRLPPPDTDPDAPLHFHFVAPAERRMAEAIEATANLLVEQRFPVTVFSSGSNDDEYLAENVVQAIALWVDALDRI